MRLPGLQGERSRKDLMKTHTPAPWSLLESPSGGMILVRPPRPGEKYAPQSHIQIVPKEDAYVMAAAPELLQALEDILANGGTTSGEWVPKASYDRAKAAVVKARGQQ